MAREEQIVQERIRKLNELRKAGINPYPYRFDKKDNSIELQEKYAKLKPDQKTKDSVKIAGRIMVIRDMGNLIFASMQDSSGKIQVVLQKGETPAKIMDFFSKYVDGGDFVGIEGTMFKTKRGEVSILAKNAELLTKSILPLPEKWHGLQDKEERYRKRYLDLIMNPSVKEVFIKRQQIMNAIREFLTKNGYIEVQTPILQPIYGGTNARPFESKLNALDMKVYMRISNEMYLKRLIAGGYEKVFEFSPDFRNEGIDKLHNPEFTQVETMWAYADYKDNMKFWPELIRFAVEKVHGKTKIAVGQNELDFKTPWVSLKFLDALRTYAKADFSKVKSLAEARSIAKKLGVDAEKSKTMGEVMIKVYEELAQPKIIQPTLVYDYPIEAAILAKAGENGKTVKSFEVIINGWEIGLSYCEENDPAILRQKWEKQEEEARKGNVEAQKMDEDFLDVLKTGMPPTSGVGMGIDRLVMLLTDQPSIRDVILFPFMKPESQEKKEEPEAKAKKGGKKK